VQRRLEESALRNYFPKPKTLAFDFEPKGVPMREEISAVLLHQPTESQRVLKQALEGLSVKVNWLQNCREALPVLREADPPHLIFTEALLPDGTWADVVKLALEALKPVKVIVVSRLIDVGLYVQTMGSGAFDFIVPPVTRDELAHVLAGAVGSVLDLRRAQATAAAG
jgi:DNA-binding NtrC family response regulator